jgi:hypothetical protein
VAAQDERGALDTLVREEVGIDREHQRRECGRLGGARIREPQDSG